MTDTPMAVDTLLEELEASIESGPRVVAIGGGHGLARALEAITEYAATITAVVSVADDGGSSGRLAPALGIPPPGDIRRALLALSPDPSLWRDLVAHRFDAGDVAGHSLGNLMLAALSDIGGGFAEAVATLGGLLRARGAVVPVSSVPLVLEAETADGIVTGQVAIARTRTGITDLRIRPQDAVANPAALEAIAGADQIVLGPGSLYTSLLAALIVDGVAEAIDASRGMLVCVANLTTQDGETLGMDLAGHLAALEEVGRVRRPDRIVVHSGPLTVPDGLEALEAPGTAGTAGNEVFVTADVVSVVEGAPSHDAARLAAVLRRLVA